MGERSKSGRVKALVIEFSRAGQSGLYLPYKKAVIKEGQAAIFSSFYSRSAVVDGPDKLKEEIRDGVVDVTAHIQDDRLILHSLADGEKRAASHIKDIANATYVIDERTDSVYYGTIGTDPVKLEKRIQDFADLMPRLTEPDRN